MKSLTAARRTRYLQIGVPAAVLGTLSGALAAVPASADAVADARAGASWLTAAGIAPSRVISTETAPATTYTVQPGDTVSTIATRFGLQVVDVLAWNGLTWRSVIYPGQSLTLSSAAASAAPTPPPAVTESAGASYTVVVGDTIYGIAQRHGATVEAVLAANGLTRASVIYPGQTLSLAASAETSTPPAAAPTSPAPVQTGGQTHTVVAGDTLFAIAQKYGTSTADLLTQNGLTTGSIIYPGQTVAVAAATVAPVVTPSPVAPPPASADLDAEQSANASLIIGIGRQLGVSDQAIALALATAMVESGMRNVSWGDRDSLGLFQQRPSTGWGTPEQVVDADRSTRAFFGGPGDPNGQTTRGLLDIPGWETMRFTDAAQAVQISAYPERYGQWETQAYQWLAQHG